MNHVNGHPTLGELESLVVASVIRRGVPALLELPDAGAGLLRGERGHALEAVRELASRGEVGPGEVPVELVVAEIARAGGNADSARTVIDAALHHSADQARRPGLARKAAGALHDRQPERPAEATPRTRILGVGDIFQPLPPVPWLCQALDLAPGAPFLVAGYGFSGKTLALQDLALAVATGTPAWGRFPVRQGRVLHLDYEQGAYLTRDRYQRLAQARGVAPRDLDGRLVLAPMPLWYLDGDAADELARLAKGFDLVIIDSFRAACPVTDENASDARIPLDRLSRLSEGTGTTYGVIHHARKPSLNATGGARMAVRGSGALYDAVGSCLVFSAEKGAPVTVEHEKARISGRPHDAFQLVIEDVEVNGDARAGLRISALSSMPPDRQTDSQRFDALQERVLALVAAQGGAFQGGSNLLARHLGARKQDVSDALAELVRQGRLVNRGSHQKPLFSASFRSGTTSEEK